MTYTLLASPGAQRELDALPTVIAEGIRKVLRILAEQPRTTRLDLRPLKGIDGEPPALRLRLGEYRVILRIYHDLQEIRVARIGHRRHVYRGVTGIGD